MPQQRFDSRGETTTASSHDDYEEDFLSEEENYETDDSYAKRALTFCRSAGDTDNEFDPSSVPACERLSIRRKTGIELVKDTVQKPEGAVPFLRLPAWNRLSMDKKIPLVPAANRSIIFSRGAIGENLLRKPKNYVNDDPLNQERVLTGSYNALHDPYAQNYFSKPSVQKQLIEQGLVTRAGQVVCTLGEFNKFRSYLNSTVYNEDVNLSLDKYNTQVKVFQEQSKKIKKEESITVGKDFEREMKAERARRKNRKILRDNMKKLRERERMKEERVLRWKITMEQQRLDRRMRADQRERARLMLLENIRQKELTLRAQRVHLIQVKETAALVRKYHECGLALAQREKQDMAWIEAKIEYQEEQEAKEELMEVSLRRDGHRRAELRQRRIENHRKNLPQFVETKIQYNRRVAYLLRKYYFKWVRATHQARMRHPDTSHQSLFPVTTKMSETVEVLKDESGLDIDRRAGKFGDVVLLLVRSRKVKDRQSGDEDEGDQGQGQGRGDVNPLPPETRKPGNQAKANSRPSTPKKGVRKKEIPRKTKKDVDSFMDDLLDNVSDQHVQSLVQEALNVLFGEARSRCDEIIREANLATIVTRPPESRAVPVSRSVTSSGEHNLSGGREESIATLFVRDRSMQSRPNSVEVWLNRNAKSGDTSRITTGTEHHKHPDESIPVDALHPEKQDVPRDLLQGQGEQYAIDQFYHSPVTQNVKSDDPSPSTESAASSPTQEAQPDTGKLADVAEAPSIDAESVSETDNDTSYLARCGTAETYSDRWETPETPETGRSENYRRSKSDDHLRPKSAKPETRRRPETSSSHRHRRSDRSRPFGIHTSRSETNFRSRSRPETARSDLSGTSSSSSLDLLVTKPESVEAIREEYRKHRCRLNRSSSPQVNYSSDEFLSFHTDEETDQHDALLQIVQEAKKLSRTDSLTSLSSFPLASEIAKSIQNAGIGKDDMECVMTKSNMFGSMESYNSFTDVVYQEMAIMAQNKTRVDELMDTLTTEYEMKVFHQEFFKKLFGMCLTDAEVETVQSISGPKYMNLASSTKYRKARYIPFTKAKSALNLGTKYSAKFIKETQSGPSVLVSKRKPGFSPRKFNTKPSTVSEQSEDQPPTMNRRSSGNQAHENHLMMGDTLELETDFEVSPRESDEKNRAISRSGYSASDEDSPRFQYEPHFKTASEVKARKSSSQESSTSHSSYATLSASSESEPVQKVQKPPKLNLKKLANIRHTKGSFGGNVYKTDDIHLRTPSRLKDRASTYTKARHNIPDPGFRQTVHAMQLAEKPRTVTLKYHSAKSSPRPSSRGESSIPKLPELPGLKQELEAQTRTEQRQPKAPENVKLPRLVPRAKPKPEILNLIMPGRTRQIPWHYARRSTGSERTSTQSLRSKQTNSSQYSTDPIAKLRPILSAIPTLFVPCMTSVDEILMLVRTVIFYKTTQQVLYVVTNELLSESTFKEETLARIQQVAIKSIIKISLPLAEMYEQRMYPEKPGPALQNYRNRVDQLSQGIASLILATLSNTNEI